MDNSTIVAVTALVSTALTTIIVAILSQLVQPRLQARLAREAWEREQYALALSRLKDAMFQLARVYRIITMRSAAVEDYIEVANEFMNCLTVWSIEVAPFMSSEQEKKLNGIGANISPGNVEELREMVFTTMNEAQAITANILRAEFKRLTPSHK